MKWGQGEGAQIWFEEPTNAKRGSIDFLIILSRYRPEREERSLKAASRQTPKNDDMLQLTPDV